VGGVQGVLAERVAAFRTQFSQESGFIVPTVSFRESAALPEQDYRS